MSPQVPILQVYIISAASACYCTHAYCTSVCLQLLPPCEWMKSFFWSKRMNEIKILFSMNSSVFQSKPCRFFAVDTNYACVGISHISQGEKRKNCSQQFYEFSCLKLTGNSILLGTNYHAVECWPGVITLFETVRSGINCKAKHFMAELLRKLDPKLAVCFCGSCKWPASIFVSSTTCEEK